MRAPFADILSKQHTTERGKRFFAGRQTMDDLPSLIVAPLTLCPQWEGQLLRFTEHGAFRVLVYSRRQTRQEFFGKGGPWEKALGRSPNRTIVIAGTSVSALKLFVHPVD
jgi:hypothetical protein